MPSIASLLSGELPVLWRSRGRDGAFVVKVLRYVSRSWGWMFLPDARTFAIDAAPFEHEWQFTRAVSEVLRCEDYFGYSPPPGQGPNWNAYA